MRRRLVRTLPALAAGLLLLTAAQPFARSRSLGGPAAAAITTTCADTFEVGVSMVPHGWGVYQGLTQPLATSDNIAGSSLDFGLDNYSWGGDLRHALVVWDPATLAPDPAAVALRTTDVWLSSYAFPSYPHAVTYWPPVVTRSLPTVAEPLRPTLALDWYIPSLTPTATTHYDTAGAANVPAALQYVYGTARTPLPGRHPVLAHSVCSGDTSVSSLWIVQSVVRADSVTDPSDDELMQTFRVPGNVRLRWIELPLFPTSIVDVNDLPRVSIVDPVGGLVPPRTLPGVLVQGILPFFTEGTPVWTSHYDFDQTITLVANHDYWLLVHTGRNLRTYARRVTADDSLRFAPQVGAAWRRFDSSQSWVRASGVAYDFRLIGQQLATDDVAPAPLATGAALRLRALANPAHGATLFAWSGARGALNFDVLDVRGRRVGGGASGTTAAGQWLWTATRTDGAPLAAGVYFVRARDAGGAQATERVVLVR